VLHEIVVGVEEAAAFATGVDGFGHYSIDWRSGYFY